MLSLLRNINEHLAHWVRRKYKRLHASLTQAFHYLARIARVPNWHLHKRSDETLSDLALMANTIVRGWINYYGRFCPSELHPLLRRINEYLIRWAERKYKRLLGRTRRAHDFLADVARREPNLFAHWRYGLRP